MSEAFSLFDFASQLITVLGPLALLWYRLHTQIIAVNQALSDYKLQVAKEYATTTAIKEVEDRIVQAIDRLGDRLDKFVDNRNR